MSSVLAWMTGNPILEKKMSERTRKRGGGVKKRKGKRKRKICGGGRARAGRVDIGKGGEKKIGEGGRKEKVSLTYYGVKRDTMWYTGMTDVTVII